SLKSSQPKRSASLRSESSILLMENPAASFRAGSTCEETLSGYDVAMIVSSLPRQPELAPNRGAGGRRWKHRDLASRANGRGTFPNPSKHTPKCLDSPSRLGKFECRNANALSRRHFAAHKVHSQMHLLTKLGTATGSRVLFNNGLLRLYVHR